jgi:hypothetical protein
VAVVRDLESTDLEGAAHLEEVEPGPARRARRPRPLPWPAEPTDEELIEEAEHAEQYGHWP